MSFHFNVNIETTDNYATHIRQIATLLGYGEPQVFKTVYKQTAIKTILGFLSIEDLRQAAREFSPKEK